MNQVLQDSLDLARIDQSSEEARLVDMSALIDSIVEEFRDRGLSALFLDSPRAPVFCKPMLTRRLARNLIDNAIKFGKAAEVCVLLTADHVEVRISDDGPGVPPEDLERVLEPFVRLEPSRSRDTGGSGLGLAIANRIARAQGAQLRLENGAHGGLQAIVSWPKPAANEH